MLIKEAKYKKVRKIVKVMVSDEVYGCDCCRKPIDEKKSYLRPSVFSHTEQPDAVSYQLCSWKCFAKWIKSIQTDYFVSLPHLSFDEKTIGLRVTDFLK